MGNTYRDLYEQYVDDITDPGDDAEWYSCRCPFHEDLKPSGGFSKKTGVFKCFSCGDTRSPAKFLQDLLDITPDESHRMVDLFRMENNLVEKVNTFVHSNPMPSPRFDRLFQESQRRMSPDHPVVKEYMAARGVKYDTLIELGVGYLPHNETSWGRDSLVFPYIHDGHAVGIRYRDIAANKSGEKNCHFTLWGIDRLETATDVVIVCEGETDCVKAHQALKGKYTVVCTPTATFRREWIREFEGARQVILVPQVDEASIKMVKQAREFIENLVVLDLPWRKRQIGNDIADWMRYNSEDAFVELIDRVISVNDRRVLTGAEFKEAAGRPRQWLIENLLGKGQVAIIGGLPKAKKSWLMLNVIRSLISKTPLLGIPQFQVPQTEETTNVLVWEEEGAIEELYERVEMVLGDLNWQANTFWAHHLGLRFDSDTWVPRVSREIEKYGIHVLAVDPFSRTYSVDEDSSSEMGIVWSRVQSLMTMHRDLTIIIIHHFNKSGTINDGWASFRGSGRTAAEVDLGIFMEARSVKDGGGAKIRIEGRSIKTPTASDGTEVFKLNFDNGILQVESHQVIAGQGGAFFESLKAQGGTWGLREASLAMHVSTTTIKRWIEKAIDPETDEPYMEVSHPAPGKEAIIRIKDKIGA